ncbi:MAG: BrnT family toxin [Sideroxydans sp.]|nr:BrnT family toxin [Sideroxydans sp.]
MIFTYDETKRQLNLDKHGLDLADAALVYNAPHKLTLQSPQNNEARLMAIALVEWLDVVLVLVYVEREQQLRAISLRRASKAERKWYENDKQNRLDSR